MKIYISSSYTDTKVYSAIAFMDKEGKLKRVECICTERTKAKYQGYLEAILKALKLIDKGIIVDDEYTFVCELSYITEWIQSNGVLYKAPKQYRAVISDIVHLCMFSDCPVKFITAKGANYAKKYATKEYYAHSVVDDIDGVSVMDLFKDVE